MVIVKREKKGRIIVRKTIAVNENLNDIPPSALAIGVGLIR